MAVWLVFFFMVTIISAVLLVPSYVLSLYQLMGEQRLANASAGQSQTTPASAETAGAQSMNSQAASPQTTNPQAVISEANSLVGVLSPTSAALAQSAQSSALASSVSTPSDIIDLINNDRSGNSINAFLYSENASGTPVVTIEGVAASRDTLLTMSQNLQGENAIGSVNLPISDLALDSNIPFSIEITMKSQ